MHEQNETRKKENLKQQMTNSKEDTFQRWRRTLHWTRGWRCVFWAGEGLVMQVKSQWMYLYVHCELQCHIRTCETCPDPWYILTETRVSWDVPDQSLRPDWIQIQESDWHIRADQTQEDSFVSRPLQVPISFVTLLELMSASDGDALRIPTTLSMTFDGPLRRWPFQVSRARRLIRPRSDPPLLKHNLRGQRLPVLETNWQNPELLK